MRAALRAIAAVLALGCIATAAYFAFDWADYGSDSTCGNFVRYKGAGPPCSDIMRNRLLIVTVLVISAIALVVAAVSRRGAAHPN